MKRQRYESEKTDALASRAHWRYMAVGLLVANIVLVLKVTNTDTTERYLLVPPTIEKAFWVKGTEVSPEYLEEMARYLSGLVLNTTPKSVDSNTDIFLRYIAPESFGATRARMGVEANRLKRNNISTAFYPVEYQTKVKEKVTVLTGDFMTTVGKQVVSNTRRTWRFSFSYVGGRLWVQEFVEVSNEFPFEQPAQDAAATASTVSE